ncbi:hypothetical protein LXL04_012772 [Taraxacum kok-saghyz]
MSNKQSRGKQQIPRKKCNEKGIKVAANSNVRKKRKQPQQLNSKSGLRLVDDLLPTDYILRKVFRKDGPPLGVEFDNLPSHAFKFCKDSGTSHRTCQEKQRLLKRKKTSNPTNDEVLEDQITPLGSAPLKHGMGKGMMTVWKLTNQESNPVKKHGMGKGLMTIQRLINSSPENLPTCVNNNDHGACSQFPPFTSQKPPTQGKKKSRRQQPVTCDYRLLTLIDLQKKRAVNKLQEKKPSTRSKKVRCEQVSKEKQRGREICELALIEGRSKGDPSQYAMLVDDEELELRELQATSNPLTCCAHCAANRLHGCSLCKDLLAKFPPDSIRMKQPLHFQPWDSSPQLVKKLFKIFHFISTYAVIIGIQSFTLDDLAQSFIDKDSMLLGKINVAFLKLLLAGIEKEIDSEFVSHISKNWKYRGLLQSIGREESDLELWKRSLNSLTWIEILRQVLVAAGFGSKRDTSSKEPVNKEAALMASYGLSPGTLKGELFTILSSQGNNGMKVSELATFSSIIELKLATTTDDIEQSISSMLSSDITLFEKISSSAYRVRSNSIVKDSEDDDDDDDDQSDLEDCGSVDDDPNDVSNHENIDDSEHVMKNKDNMLTVISEIDESNPGEMWLSGLMEGEYSDLNIEEKLNALLALIDLIKAGSSIRLEEPVTSVHHIGSGAKIKRSTAKQIENDLNQMISCEQDRLQDMQPIDSSSVISVIQNATETETKTINDLHPMQSIYLGSDRRYNQYWLFLGPCNIHDPGHKRIYFESSEDGHWEVIESEEALANLLSGLDQRGRRECHLFSSLQNRAGFLSESMSSGVILGQPALSGDSSSAVSDVDNLLGLHASCSVTAAVTSVGNREQKWCRVQEFDVWLWGWFNSVLNAVKHGKKSFLDSLARCERCHDLFWRDEKHCRICHTTFEVDFDLEERYAVHAATCRDRDRDDSSSDMYPKHKVLPSQLQSLKAAAYALESCMPEGSMVGAWTKCAHNLWVKRLRRTSTLVELIQVLGDFVGAINKGSGDLNDIIRSFGCMPQTSSAVALWLVKLDLLVAPYLDKVEIKKTTRTSNVSTRNRSKGKEIDIVW